MIETAPVLGKMTIMNGKYLFPRGINHPPSEWSKQPFDGHDHYWSGWAAIWRNGYEICLECGINKLELWELTHGRQ